MGYYEGMSKEKFILNMMEIIGRPSKTYVEEKGKGVVDFCVEWPMYEDLDRLCLSKLLEYFNQDESLLGFPDSLVDILSDYRVPEGAYYEKEGDLEAYPNDYKHFTREVDY